MAFSGSKSFSPEETLILYDIPSKSPNRPWSPNTWKTRLALLYKKIPFITHWIEYPDIEPTLKAAGVPPNPPSAAPWPYTLPTVFFPATGEYIMESSAIIERLEQKFPSPPLHVDSPLVERVNNAFADMLGFSDSLYLHGVPAKILNPRSEGYFRKDRKRILGMEIEQYATEQRRREAIETAAPYVIRLADMLRADDAGPFLMGKVVSYADFIIVAWMLFWVQLRVLEDLTKVNNVPLRRLFEACSPWVQGDH